LGEIGWGRAFGYAARFLVFSILWVVVGGLLVGVGVAMVLASLGIAYGWPTRSYGPTPSAGVNLALLIGSVVVVVAGVIIAELGTLATFFKLTSRLVGESVHRAPAQ
jgi:amino acid transporter